MHSECAATEIWDLVERYETLNKLLRVTARLFQAIRRFNRADQADSSVVLLSEDVERARIFWIRATQRAYFETELKILEQGKPRPQSNSLLKLSPFLDSSGIMRLGGRLKHSQLEWSAKHPVLLPRTSALTQRVIDDVHRRTLHGGVQLSLSTLRQEYWVIGGRAPIRSFILRCVCARQRGETAKQMMGKLPSLRTKPSRPFLHSGVDYAGHYVLKTWRHRAAKTYKA